MAFIKWTITSLVSKETLRRKKKEKKEEYTLLTSFLSASE